MRSHYIFNRFLAHTVQASLLVLFGFSIGCESSSPSRPTPQPPLPGPLSVTAISPNTGATVRTAMVTIRGTGFLPGATVALDGAATQVAVVNSVTITATVHAHAAGTVDVVVTNPDGQSARLTGAFTYVVDLPYTLTSSLNTVTTGSQLSVSWTAPRGGTWDWVAFFKMGAPSESYENYWWRYTNGAPSGTLTLTALEPGRYEFRYFLDDGFEETARTSPVTVMPATAARER